LPSLYSTPDNFYDYFQNQPHILGEKKPQTDKQNHKLGQKASIYKIYLR